MSDATPTSATASNQLISWPIALQCARERLRSGPAIAFIVLLACTGFYSSGMRSPAQIFGGSPIPSIAHLIVIGLTLLLGSGIISEEIESGHAQLVLLRPVSRAAFFGGRLAGAGLALFAAMLLPWIISCALAIAAGDFVPAYLLALPVAFVETLAWLALIAALSSVLRGSGNSLWALIGAFLWLFARYGLAGASALANQLHRGELLQAFSSKVQLVLPFLRPQGTSELVEQQYQHAAIDFGPLLFDLVWIAAFWTLGAYLFSRRELARRRA